jgi:Rnl2 family RNA ligase
MITVLRMRAGKQVIEMDFQKYSSITNSYDTKFINKIIAFGYDKIEWVTTNKIHGANFTFYTDGTYIQCASKNGILEAGDKFFNYKELLERYKSRVLELHKVITETYNHPIHQVSLYGEYFGGTYNHPEVKRISGVSKIQKGIQYCPDNDFCLIDIKLDGKLIDYDGMVGLAKLFGFLYTEPLCRGTMQECLEYPNDYQDPTYKYYGLPVVEGDNVCEGTVVRPVKPIFFDMGDGGFKRVILKNKNEIWKEKANATDKVRVQHEVNENVQEQIGNLSLLITDNRLENVLSHLGTIEAKDFGKLIKEFSMDVWEDYQNEYGDEYNMLDKDEQKSVGKWCASMSAGFLKPKFKELCYSTD